MKYLIPIFAFLFSFIFLKGCSEEDKPQLEAYNAEAFAYDIGGSWEVNASARVKGFMQAEENDNYTLSLAYEIDLITPAGDTLRSLITRVEDKESKETLTDIPLEVQFELDSSYTIGDYMLIFRVNEPETGNSAVTAAGFTL